MTPLTRSLYNDLFIQEQHEISMHFDDIYMYGISSHPCKEEIESFNRYTLRHYIPKSWRSWFDQAINYKDKYTWYIILHQETAQGPKLGMPCKCHLCLQLDTPSNAWHVTYSRIPYMLGTNTIPLKHGVKQWSIPRLTDNERYQMLPISISYKRSQQRKQRRVDQQCYLGVRLLFSVHFPS